MVCAPGRYWMDPTAPDEIEPCPVWEEWIVLRWWGLECPVCSNRSSASVMLPVILWRRLEPVLRAGLYREESPL